MASSSSSTATWNHDVFLSFRGEDTRKTFVDHLYDALLRQGIYTYKDDETLPVGESIAPALSNAIQKSRIALVVFSENYAGSSWCLEELACIMKCKDDRGQIVMPIFYHVEPSHVRKQEGNFGEGFAKLLALKNKDKVESWRKALFDASNISGWETMHIANGHESKGIKEIVNKISDALLQLTPVVNEDLIGMRARLQKLKSQLEIDSGGVRMVGIWGIGGGGKTTLASSLYYEICSRFDGHCFLENIREESSKYGLKKLQENFLRHILKQEKIGVETVEEGRHMINSRLHHRNVLIVLDDVDHLDQLKALAGSHAWFGEGSRIIITTRNEHFLKAHKVDVVYNISLLNDVEAAQLFHKHAFLDDRCIEEFGTLSNDFVSYASGLPLALKVLGSFLCGKEVSEWKSELAKLKDIPKDDILRILKISYDGLEPIQQELFLDIACFFKGMNQSLVASLLDACGFHVGIGIKVLIQKALITIVDDRFGMRTKEFGMHDLVQEMGHYIVRRKHPHNPEKHSRIWREEDFLKICTMDSITENNTIEAVAHTLFTSDNRLPLIVGNMKKLRWIVWDWYPTSSLPTNFQPMGLCYLKLGESSLKQLWKGKKHLPSLKVLDLNRSSCLIKIPGLSGLPFLEKLILLGCGSLKEIHPSIGCHERLVLLNIHGCSKLQSFPPIVRMKKVETLNFSFCYGLRKFPEIQTNMDSLKHLNLSYSGIEVVPSSIRQYCTNLESLHLGSRLHPKRLTTNFHLLKYLKMLRLSHHTLADENILFDISQFSNLEHLKELRLSWCSLEDENIASDISQLSNLDILDLSGNKFTRIGCSLSQLVHLKFLKISHCENLVELPDLPSCIAVLDASGCTSLEILGGFPTNCKWLWKVSLQRKTEVGHIDVERVVESMLEGNAVETYYMNLHVDHVDMLARSHQHLQLPLNWYNDFAGFLIRVAVQKYCRVCSIVMKQGMHMDYQSDLLQSLGKTDKWGDSIYCYISFGWLKQTSWWNSSYTTILFAIGGAVGMAAEVVPRRKKKSKGDTIERANGIPADCCQFWEEGFENQKAFTVAHDSKSSLEIQWRL